MASNNNNKGNSNQLLPVVPGVRHDFALSTTDFSCFGQITASTLLKYATDARWMAFATWPALSKMVQDDAGADVMVKAHLIRFLKPNRCLPASLLGVSQTPHAVGSFSLTLSYEFFEEESDEAFAQVLTVCVRMKEGQSLPLPSYVVDDLVWRHKATELEDTTDIVVLSKAIERSRAATMSASSSGRIAHEVLVRMSDTDRRRLVHSHRLLQFFEDSYGATRVPDVVYVELLDELRAKTRCDVVSVPNNDNGGQELISFLVDKDTGKTSARVYVSWANKALKDN